MEVASPTPWWRCLIPYSFHRASIPKYPALAIFPLPTKCPLLEMGGYQEIKRKLHGLLPDFGDLTVQGFFEVEEADLKAVLALLTPREDLNGTNR